MNTTKDRYQEEVQRLADFLALFVTEQSAIELRALQVTRPDFRRRHTELGFFDCDHLDEMARIALELSGTVERPGPARNVYFTINPLVDDVLALRYNRIAPAEEGDGAQDDYVLRRTWLLIDADPVRPFGLKVSATDTEKAAAYDVIMDVRDWLDSRDWQRPIFCDSGNGFHLLYPVDLPKDDGEHVKTLLNDLADRFDTDQVTIDRKVFNPSRITKCYGTVARKGDHTAKRPHRVSKILEVPQWS